MTVAMALLGGVRFALGFTFLLASSAKLCDVRGLLRGIDDYQVVPKALVHPAGITVIALELAVGMGLLTGLSSVWMGSGAVVLGMAFVIVIGVNLRRGRRPVCKCFGSGSEETISWRSLIRAALLTACAIAIVLGAAGGWEGPKPGLQALLPGLSLTPIWEAALGLFLLTFARWLLALPDVRLALFSDRIFKGASDGRTSVHR